MHGVFLAVRPLHLGAHRLGIFRAEIEDVADLDAARRQPWRRRRMALKAASSCISEVAA